MAISKNELLTNLREYTAAEIVDAIKCGVVTMDELEQSGKMSDAQKNRIELEMAAQETTVERVSENYYSDPKYTTDEKWLSPKGRIRRRAYWGRVIILGEILWLVVEAILDGAVRSDSVGLIFASLLLLLFWLWFVIVNGIKRCHDLGHSGWFIFIPFYSLVLAFCGSDKGSNKWGPNPKGE